jgi:hypothetical protein
MNEIVSAAINGKNYNETVILINYDGTILLNPSKCMKFRILTLDS